MNKMFFSLITSIALILPCIVQASILEIDGKYYVSTGSSYAAPEAIYVSIEGELYPVSGPFSDYNGVYFTDD